MMPSLLKIGQALTMALLLSCKRDKPLPAYVQKIVLRPRDTAAVNAHRNDSAYAVLLAVAALNRIEPQQPYRVIAYQRTDSGTVVSLVPVCDTSPHVGCGGGGGRVFVDSLGRAKVIEGFQ